MSASRIIHVPRRFVAHEWGGTETVILELSKQQQAAGMDPVVMTSMALADSRNDTVGGIPVSRYPHIYPYLGLRPENRLALDKKGGNLLSPSLLIALLRCKNVRLFHAHSLKRLGGIVRTAARLRGLPYVASLHGGVFDVPAEELASLTDPVRGKLEWGQPFGALLGSRRVLEDADHVICVGKTEAEMARKSLSHDRVSHLPNGVDSARFADGDGSSFRTAHRIPDKAFLVSCISRIDPQKNQITLIKAFLEMCTEIPDAHLCLIGPETHAPYAAEIRTLVEQSGHAERIHLLPGLKNDDPMLIDAYHAADLFVLPSRHEPFGIAVLEAWSSGKAVVASEVGGLKSLLREGETGMFFDPAAADASHQLAHILTTLARDPQRRESLGSHGREEARREYDWSSIHLKLEDIYQQATDHRKGGRR